MSEIKTEPTWMAAIRAEIGKTCGKLFAWDPVNAPMIRHWCEAMGVVNPIYTNKEAAKNSVHGQQVAPPAMLQAWILSGLHKNNYPEGSTQENPYKVLQMLEDQGLAAVVAVNTELDFKRYLRMDECLYYTSTITDISEEKATGLGVGYFVTQMQTYYSVNEAGGEDECVGSMMFRLFKFKPTNAPKPIEEGKGGASALPKIGRSTPGISPDTQFWWDGVNQGKLMIQRCKACQTLRHPPGPACPECQSFEWDAVESKGQGHIYSFVVMHYPEVPPFDHPNPIGLIELDEGTRLVGQLLGLKSNEYQIGQRVQVEFNTFNDGTMTLPQWRVVG
ncbi:MAG: bifunctional MaoC family dehydratase N-terminal/OB-fold nucleic acid binding domain-containing protein [Brachymonas sp.]